MIPTMRSVHVLPWEVTGIGGGEGLNDMIRTEASVAAFEVLCLELLAESKILPLARPPSAPPFGCPTEATMTPTLDNGAASLNRSTLRPKRDRRPCEGDRGLRRREPSRLRCTPGRC